MEVSAAERQSWTTLSLVNWCAEYLFSKEFDSPRLTAELLLSQILRCTRIDLYTGFDRPLSRQELAQFKVLFQRRLTHEPLQYILGNTEFMGLKFGVDARVLIPRPETEVLVEQVIELSKHYPTRTILDIGTGSGNIAISLAKHIEAREIDAVDISDAALEVAQVNVELHHCEQNVRLRLADVLSENVQFPLERYDVIVSNPPYISQAELTTLQPEVRDFEPRIATTDGDDGLTFYRAVTRIGKTHAVSGGWIVVEFAYNQSDAVKTLFQNAGYSNIEIVCDYNRTPRVLKARWL